MANETEVLTCEGCGEEISASADVYNPAHDRDCVFFYEKHDGCQCNIYYHERCDPRIHCCNGSHEKHYGALWACAKCQRQFCWAEGTDNHPEVCDACWVALYGQSGFIYLDIETLDFFQDEHIKALPRDEQLKAIRFGIGVTIDSADPSPKVWRQDQIIDLYNYLCWCGKTVVGWNINNFDIPVIVNSASRAGHNVLEIEYETIATLDFFEEIRRHTGRWYKLEIVAQATLGRGKLADGQSAAEWLRTGNPDDYAKAIEYCAADVELVREIHRHWLDAGAIVLPPRAERNEINEIRWWQLGGFERMPDALGVVSTR